MKPTRLILAAAAALAFVPASAAAYTIVDYPFTPNDDVTKIVAAPSGIWWTGTVNDVLGHLVPAQATPGTSNGIAHLPADTGGSYPQGLTVGPDGFLYFAEYNGAGRQIDKMDPATGEITHLSGTDYGRDLAFSATTHALYFTTQDDKVGLLSGAGYAGTASLSTTVSYPYAWGIASDAAGNIWFGEDGRNATGGQGAIGKVPAGGGLGFSEYLAPTAGAEPQQLTVDHAGNVWFAERNGDAIGELNPAAVSNGSSAGITEYTVPVPPGGSSSGHPIYITTAPDGSIWFTVDDSSPFTHNANNQIGRIVPPATPGGPVTFSMTSTPDGVGYAGITADAAGNIWFISGGQVGEIVGAAPPLGGGGGGAPPPGGGGGGGGGGTTMTTVAGTASIHGAPPKTITGKSSVPERLVCSGPPGDECSVVFDLDTRENYATGGLMTGLKPGIVNIIDGFVDKKKKPKSKNVVVGHKTVTLHGGQSATVKVSINATGKKLLKKFKKLPTTLGVLQSLNGGKQKLVQKSTVTFKVKAKKKKKH